MLDLLASRCRSRKGLRDETERTRGDTSAMGVLPTLQTTAVEAEGPGSEEIYMSRKPSVRKINWRTSFLEAVKKYGDMSSASRATGVSRPTVYRAMRSSDTFRQAIAEALEEHFDMLRLSLLKIALGDSEKAPDRDSLKFLLMRDRYNRRFVEDEPGGPHGALPIEERGGRVMTVNVNEETAREINDALDLVRSGSRLCGRCRAELE